MSFSLDMVPNPVMFDVLNHKEYKAQRGWVDVQGKVSIEGAHYQELLAHRFFLTDKDLSTFKEGYPVLVKTEKNSWACMVHGFARETPYDTKKKKNPY